MSNTRSDSVAIVGIGCLFPKAPDLASYWKNILLARDCITDVPENHSWSKADYFDPDPTVKDKTYCARGGFLDALPFDPTDFGIPPNQLESIDTSQLLSLVVARQCLIDAGVDPEKDDWDKDHTAVILGSTGTQELAITMGARLFGHLWKKSMVRCGVDDQLADIIVKDIGNHMPTWTEQSFPGLLGNVISGRITNRFDLGGTNASVDAACASSLAALQYAIGDLMAGRSNMVISGGVDTLNDNFMFQCFTRTPAFSASQDAKPFGHDSDGIVIGEGIAMVALKRLADAERDGNRIYAVIKGVGSSSDGRGKSIYAPVSEGQAKAIRRTYEIAGVNPETIELLEAHGTGTKAGDIAEIGGLKLAYSGSKREDQWVALGSVKSQIGHTKSTAGAAGLVKAALALHHRVLPPTAKIERPNPKMEFEKSPFYVNTLARPWIRAKDHPRRAAVSAFGFGGSNFHALLEEYGDDTAVAPVELPDTELFLLSANTPGQLVQKIEQLERDLAKAPTWRHAARATLEKWQSDDFVLAFVAANASEALEKLKNSKGTASAGQTAVVNGAEFGVIREWSAPRLAVLFPGQGSQYVDMGRTALLHHPKARGAFDRADEAFRKAGRKPLSRVVFPIPAFSEADKKAQTAELTRTEWAQPALGALEKGLFDLLMSFGVTPEALAGHSYGELVALHAAGVYDEETLWELSRIRGEAMADKGVDRGAMAAVQGDLNTIQAMVDDWRSGVVLANRNHPTQGVISGPKAAIDDAVKRLTAAGIVAKKLEVSAAFHSPLVADARAPMTTALQRSKVEPAQIPVWSNKLGRAYPKDKGAIRELLADQIVYPVDFVGMIQDMAEQGIRVFVECGPKTVLSGLVKETLKGRRDVLVVSLDNPKDKADGDTQLKIALARMAARGVSIDPSPLLKAKLPWVPKKAPSAAAVPLGGANYRTELTRNPPMPALPPVHESGVRVVEKIVDRVVEKIVHVPVAADGSHGAPMMAPSGGLAALIDSTRQTLNAFQAAQERTAKVHAEFLAAHRSATDGFTQLFETHTRLVASAAGRPAAPSADPLAGFAGYNAPAGRGPTTNAMTPTHEGAPSFQSRKAQALPPVFDARQILGGAAQGTSTTGHTQAPKAPLFAAAPAAPAAPAGKSVVDALLGVVSEKTGYPLEMLELSMDMESDLGIDSIKRVEILAAVQDAVPGLPELDNDRLSAMRTLEEIATALREALPAGSPAASASALAAAPRSTLAAPAGGGREAVVAGLLKVVSEKTGYPLEMLELGMDMESDLGIDSIKRVEILAAVQDNLPGLPEVDNDRLNALRTLQEVVDELASAMPASTMASAPISQGSGPDRGGVVSALLKVVSEKTGYPFEMLEMGMDMESDLGIDSIKRVEILAAVQDAIPGLPEADNDRLNALRTLQEVADELAKGLVAPAASVSTAQPQTATPLSAGPLASQRIAEPGNGPERRLAALRPAPSGFPCHITGAVAITRDHRGLAEELAEALNKRSVQAFVIDPADWSRADNVAVAIPSGTIGLIHLATVGASGPDLQNRVRGAFLAAKALQKADLFVTVTAQGGSFGLDGLTEDPLQGAVAGLTKTLAHEWPRCRCLAIDLAKGVDIDRLAAEILLDRGFVEVGLKADRTVVVHHELTDLEGSNKGAPVKKGELVVVSGGARGVTADVVVEMARRWHPALLLLGRTAIVEQDPTWALGVADADLKRTYIQECSRTAKNIKPAEVDQTVQEIASNREIRKTLADIRATGTVVEYRAVDGRDRVAVMAAVGEAVKRFGPVRGLVHGAGVLADKLVVDKTEDQFDKVFSTKVEGLRNLLEAVDQHGNQELAMLAMFSSVAGRYGNRGQCDYAMANETLTRFAAVWAHKGTRAKSFSWGPWDGGMVNATLKKAFQNQGIALIDRQGGARFFCDEFEQGGDNVEVVVGGPEDGGALIDASQKRPLWEVRYLDNQAPWLKDHTIAGHPVLPAAMVVEWMVAAAEKSRPELKLHGVKNLRVLKGVTLHERQTPLTLRWVTDELAGGAVRLHFTLEGVKGPASETVAHYRGDVELSPTAPVAGRFPGSNGLGKQPYPRTPAEAYEKFLFHGPTLHGITKFMGWSDEGFVARVNNSEPGTFGEDGAHWATDPLAVDSALQLMVLWVREKLNATALPMAIAEYQQFGAFDRPVTCHLEVQPQGARNGVFGATFVDDTGRVVARLLRCEFVATPTLAFGEA